MLGLAKALFLVPHVNRFALRVNIIKLLVSSADGNHRLIHVHLCPVVHSPTTVVPSRVFRLKGSDNQFTGNTTFARDSAGNLLTM
jgi:hypothetical protein